MTKQAGGSMRRIYGGMAALFFLTGCAADANDGYRKVLDAYLGKPESTLTASLGTPESIYSGDGGYRYLSYPNQKKTDTPATPAIYVTSCRFNICTSTTTGRVPDGERECSADVPAAESAAWRRTGGTT